MLSSIVVFPKTGMRPSSAFKDVLIQQLLNAP